MVVSVKNNKLDLRRILVYKINYLLYSYMNSLDIESIHFNNEIDGISFFKIFPHYSETDFVSDWHSDRIKSTTLLEVLKCLKRKEFYGFCRTTTGQLVKIKPKKNV